MVKARNARAARRRLVALLAFVGACAGLGVLGVSTGAGATGLHALRGDVLHVRGARNLGALSPSQRITVAITLKQNLNAIYRSESAIYDPRSPSFHHYLTPTEFHHLYGTPPSVLAAVRSFGTSHGLELFNPGVLYDYVELYGTVRQVEQTFGVQLDRFSERGIGTFYANLQNPLVPAGLPIDAVLGLESLSRFHTADLRGSTVKAAGTGISSAKAITLTASNAGGSSRTLTAPPRRRAPSAPAPKRRRSRATASPTRPERSRYAPGCSRRRSCGTRTTRRAQARPRRTAARTSGRDKRSGSSARARPSA